MSNSKWWSTFSVQIFDFFILFSFRFYTSSQVFGKIMHLMTGWQSWVLDVPVVEAVFVGSGLTDGFTGNRGGVGGLACSRRLSHTYIYTNTEENIHIHSQADIHNHGIDYALKKSCKSQVANREALKRSTNVHMRLALQQKKTIWSIKSPI